MADDISTASVSSRFVSQSELEQAKANRDEQWKAAYARLGQEPPPKQDEVVSDGRSLFERLQTNKLAKEEQWQEQHKLSKQFRALEEDEILFLQQVKEKKYQEEQKRKLEERSELESFRTAVAARYTAPPPPVPGSSFIPTVPKPAALPAKKVEPAKPQPRAGGKKDQKALLKGVVVKKGKQREKEKDVAGAPAEVRPAAVGEPKVTQEGEGEGRVTGGHGKEPAVGKRSAEDDDSESPGAKRRRVT
ncbi:hypothetical protein CALVIDRAFT_537668 [Calocera viscosa TUFC12733]|uniref:FAM192A/Fyv6 N-terminal domain-containing protein n=1 Tax=Calocera viscosa (strain TUFC12733) TaxID=1330018 RepID=A0A167LVU4_CALVF|nr:hypothetical protein CALVIDRAFT_537668 [Calocera viscosa TUFC12733]